MIFGKNRGISIMPLLNTETDLTNQQLFALCVFSAPPFNKYYSIHDDGEQFIFFAKICASDATTITLEEHGTGMRRIRNRRDTRIDC